MIFIIKWILYAIVIAYAVVGAVIAGVGCWIMNNFKVHSEYIPSKAVDYVAYFFIGVGALLLCVALVGFAATFLDNYLLMLLFGICSALVLVCEVIIMGLGFYLPKFMMEKYTETYTEELENYDFQNMNTMYKVDIAQKAMKCCGRDEYQDWFKKDHNIPAMGDSEILPPTCCKELPNGLKEKFEEAVKEAGGNLLSGTPPSGELEKLLKESLPTKCGGEDNIHMRGCALTMDEIVGPKMETIAYISLIVGIAQLVSVIFVYCIAPRLMSPIPLV